jgi:hypothetical protein
MRNLECTASKQLLTLAKLSAFHPLNVLMSSSSSKMRCRNANWNNEEKSSTHSYRSTKAGRRRSRGCRIEAGMRTHWRPRGATRSERSGLMVVSGSVEASLKTQRTLKRGKSGSARSMAGTPWRRSVAVTGELHPLPVPQFGAASGALMPCARTVCQAC